MYTQLVSIRAIYSHINDHFFLLPACGRQYRPHRPGRIRAKMQNCVRDSLHHQVREAVRDQLRAEVLHPLRGAVCAPLRDRVPVSRQA